jgi:hypothetical protein
MICINPYPKSNFLYNQAGTGNEGTTGGSYLNCNIASLASDPIHLTFPYVSSQFRTNVLFFNIFIPDSLGNSPSRPDSVGSFFSTFKIAVNACYLLSPVSYFLLSSLFSSDFRNSRDAEMSLVNRPVISSKQR